MKTITAAEVKPGDQIRKPGKFEMWVEHVDLHDNNTVTIWGSEVHKFGASEYLLLVNENWGDK